MEGGHLDESTAMVPTGRTNYSRTARPSQAPNLGNQSRDVLPGRSNEIQYVSRCRSCCRSLPVRERYVHIRRSVVQAARSNKVVASLVVPAFDKRPPTAQEGSRRLGLQLRRVRHSTWHCSSQFSLPRGIRYCWTVGRSGSPLPHRSCPRGPQRRRERAGAVGVWAPPRATHHKPFGNRHRATSIPEGWEAAVVVGQVAQHPVEPGGC